MEPPQPKDQPSPHPPAYRLDALAAGDADADASAHLASCEACTHYVSDLRMQAGQFRSAQDGRAFVARAAATGARRARGARLVRVAWIATPTLAAAAVVLLVLRARPPDGGFIPGMPGSASSSAGPESRFKGGVVVTVIRERQGRQERLVGAMQVRAGDRIRVEVSTDQERPIAAGLLSDDGEWASLIAASALEAGTHYSELAARFDESPTRATLLVGEPGDVDRARRTRDFTGVVAWRVTSEPGP